MATSSEIDPRAVDAGDLRLRLSEDPSAGQPDGAWWPRSRDLQREAADLVDHFPTTVGVVSRLLFSRPDWDHSSTDGHGVRTIRAARGRVKVGSFPSDDTHLMVLTMGSGRRLRLVVIPPDTPAAEAEDRLRGSARTGDSAVDERTIDQDRWDDESPSR